MTKIKNIFSPVFFNILKEPLLVQKQMIHQQKALDLSYLETEEQGLGFIRKPLCFLAVKAYFVEFYGRLEGFWLLAFYEISRTPLLRYTHFYGVKLKLRSKAFFWGIVCFNTSIINMINVKLNFFPDIAIIHPGVLWGKSGIIKFEFKTI